MPQPPERREADVLKQELARLRAGSNGSAAPAAPDKGELSIAGLAEYPLSCRREGRLLSADGEDVAASEECAGSATDPAKLCKQFCLLSMLGQSDSATMHCYHL